MNVLGLELDTFFHLIFEISSKIFTYFIMVHVTYKLFFTHINRQ